MVSARKRLHVSAVSWIPAWPPVEVFIFSRSFPPEIKAAYFPKHLIIPLSLDDVVGLWRGEDFLLEDAARSSPHLSFGKFSNLKL